MRRYPNSTIAEVIELWRMGLSHQQVLQKTGICYDTQKIWISNHWFKYKGENSIVVTLSSKI
jgi:hypothetical protein